jgi:hypothetical protein
MIGVSMFYWGSDRLICKLIKQLQKMDMRTIHPAAFKSKLVRKEEGTNMALVYNVTAGPVVDKDVSERRLNVTVNGETTISTFTSEVTSFGEFSFPDNANVVLTLVDVDDAGNVSSPAVVEFVAMDTIPPAKPGEFGVTLVREE